jgi:hypothetical protein
MLNEEKALAAKGMGGWKIADLQYWLDGNIPY